MKKKLLAWLLVLALSVGALSVTAFATGGEVTSATVSFTAQASGVFISPPATHVAVN